MKSFYEELSNLDEQVHPLVVTPEQTGEVTKPMEKIMKELLVRYERIFTTETPSSQSSKYFLTRKLLPPRPQRLGGATWKLIL